MCFAFLTSRNHREITRVDVPSTRIAKLGRGFTEGRLQEARPAERALERLKANYPNEQTQRKLLS